VSYIVPTLHSIFTIRAPDESCPHHPSFAAAAGTETAHEEALVVGKALALTGLDMVTNKKLLQLAREQWKQEIRDN
jgi:hypothetical protein